jgi:hypothetical protein
MLGSSSVAAQLVVSQERISSMKLFIFRAETRLREHSAPFWTQRWRKKPKRSLMGQWNMTMKVQISCPWFHCRPCWVTVTPSLSVAGGHVMICQARTGFTPQICYNYPVNRKLSQISRNHVLLCTRRHASPWYSNTVPSSFGNSQIRSIRKICQYNTKKIMWQWNAKLVCRLGKSG